MIEPDPRPLYSPMPEEAQSLYVTAAAFARWHLAETLSEVEKKTTTNDALSVVAQIVADIVHQSVDQIAKSKRVSRDVASLAFHHDLAVRLAVLNILRPEHPNAD